MAQGPNEKKFEAVIDLSTWEPFEEWLSGRGKISNPQILQALLWLFMAAPQWLKLFSFFATQEELEKLPRAVWREIVDSLIQEATPTSAEADQRKRADLDRSDQELAEQAASAALSRESKPRRKRTGSE